MRVDFVGHAALLLQHGGLRLLSDPWWSSPAYRHQWYPYPIPVPERYDLSQISAVYISHSHEDHLHAPTLRALLKRAPNAQAIIPRRYEPAMRDYLRRIGFRRITELISGAPLTLGSSASAARLTLFTHLDDSLLAVEAGGEVLLNLNDALHASRRELIEEYCRILHRRFPRIDYLFCGFGGASYFPNCVHVPGKDDLAVARARERFFLDNFALIAARLRPRYAFPFAAHFVLPEARTWWISRTRLELGPPSPTLRRLLPGTRTEFCDLQPGDFVEDGRVHCQSPAPVPVEAARSAALDHYGPPRQPPPLDAAGFSELVAEVRRAVERHPRRPPLEAVIRLTDSPQQAMHLVATPDGVQVQAVDQQQLGALRPQVTLETRSDLLRSAMRSPFGKDLISIGYGAEVYLGAGVDAAAAPHDRLLQLLAPPPPRWRHHLRQRPQRALPFLLGDPSLRYAFASRILRRLRRRPSRPSGPAPYELGSWVMLPEG